MTEIGDSSQEALLNIPGADAPRHSADNKVEFMIGIRGECHPSSRAAIRGALERELLNLAKFGVDLHIMVDYLEDGTKPHQTLPTQGSST